MTILSILIPTISARKAMFDSLVRELDRQCGILAQAHPTLGYVELRFEDGEPFLNGGMSIGKKRQELVKYAQGKYLCFLDDDENIAPNYIETLVRLCQHDRDVCTFRAIAKNDNFWSIIDMSIYHPDVEASPNYEVLRNIWHVCPIRSSFAKLYGFEDINYGEDAAWLLNVRKHITSEAKSQAILLCYNHSKSTSESDRITKFQNETQL